MRWVALAVSIFALTIGALWMLFVHAPAPTVVCEHKIELALAGVTDQDPGPLIEHLQSTCVQNAERRIQLRGRIKYANYAKCVVAAESLEEAERCSSGS